MHDSSVGTIMPRPVPGPAAVVLAAVLALLAVQACGPPASLPAVSPGPACTAVGQAWTRPADGMQLVCVPAGPFLMGLAADDPQAWDYEKPQRTVTLDAYWIDRTVVNNAQYRRCLEAGACREPTGWGDDRYNADNQPAVGLSWDDAVAYCAWAGARLPTEAQWEKAARGTDGRLYPWGGAPPTCDLANYKGCVGRPAPVGSYPAGASPYGALDMAGNVWEWAADWYESGYYIRAPVENPPGPGSGAWRVLRGGAWYDEPGRLRTAGRGWYEPRPQSINVGFRCAVPAP